MRRSERHHLKENAFATAVGNLQGQVQRFGRVLTIGLLIGAGCLATFGGYSWFSSRAAAQAGTLLANALAVADAPVVPPPPPSSSGDTSDNAAESIPPHAEAASTQRARPTEEPATADASAEFTQPLGTYPSLEAKLIEALPRLLDAADAYPTTRPGITARYRAAAALAALGRHEEASVQYQRVIDSDAAGVYTRMAALGLADTHIVQGAYSEAIALLEQSSSTAGAVPELPVDGVLMRLGHAYGSAGRAPEARAAYQRIMDEFPLSLYAANAEREFEALLTEN